LLSSNLFANGEQADEWRVGLGSGVPIEEPPYLTIRLVPATAKAFGGVDVDLYGRVVDPSGEPIPGLYAAGELTGMAGGSMVGDLSFSGSLSAVLLSIKIAGQTAGVEGLDSR
jgi:predicted oxidoreductase